MLTSNISLSTPVCQIDIYNNLIGFRVLCDHKFGDNRSQRVFFAQMTSCDVTYDVIYHPFPINSQYLKTWGVDSHE